MWKDKQLIHQNYLYQLVDVENLEQIHKWGIQNRLSFEWMNFLTEEVGELAKAISENMYRNGPSRDIVTEAIQVATLALKIAEMNLNFQKEKTINVCGIFGCNEASTHQELHEYGLTGNKKWFGYCDEHYTCYLNGQRYDLNGHPLVELNGK